MLFALAFAPFRVLARTLFSYATRIFLRLLPGLLFLGAPAVFVLDALAFATLVLEPLDSRRTASSASRRLASSSSCC